MSFLRLARPLFPAARQPAVLRAFSTTPARCSTAVLPRLKADLKDAMRAKDKPRLDVIRAMLSEILNASKTARPIDSDSKLLALLRKQMASSEKAIAEFTAAQRVDLVEKEQGQVDVMQKYVDEIPVLRTEEVDALVDEVVGGLRAEAKDEAWKPQYGALMKAVMAKIDGRPVDQKYVTEKLKSLAA